MSIANKPAINIANNFASTSATTGAFVQLVAASGMPTYNPGRLQYSNSTGKIIMLAYGASGVEQKWLQVPPSVVPVVLDVYFPGGQRLSMNTVDANATSGWLTLDFFIP